MLRLYDYAPSGNCYKVRLLLSHLGVAYERVPVDIFDGGTLTPEFERLNPLRATPVLELEDGRTLIESDAIMWFLASGTPFLPSDPADQADVPLRLVIVQHSAQLPVDLYRSRKAIRSYVRPLHQNRCQ